MDISEKNFNQVSDNLLSFLRDELDDSKVDYEACPSRIQGGNETYIFQFKLKNVHSSLSEPMVLRLFRKDLGFRPKHAIMENVVHNSLVDQGVSVEEQLQVAGKKRQDERTSSIAVGSKVFVENVKARLRFRAKGRDVVEAGERYQLRENLSSYKALFGVKNEDIALKNTYFWDVKSE